MAGYVRRVVADPGSNVRINRSGAVIVEDNTLTDADARALRDSEYVPRVYSRDKRNPSAGYEDGGYDPKNPETALDRMLRTHHPETGRKLPQSGEAARVTPSPGASASIAGRHTDARPAEPDAAFDRSQRCAARESQRPTEVDSPRRIVR